MSDDPTIELTRALAGLFRSGQYSDLTIQCGDDVYKVHKNIVCTRSPVLAKMCDGEWEEARTGVIKLHPEQDDPVAVKLMLYYLYYLDYPHQPATEPVERIPEAPGKEMMHVSEEPPITEESTQLGDIPNGSFQDVELAVEPPIALEPLPEVDDLVWFLTTMNSKKKKGKKKARSPKPPAFPNLSIHAKVYTLGEVYDIRGLKRTALNKFESEAEQHWDTIDFLDSVGEVFMATPDHDKAMRDVVLSTITKHLDLLDRPEVQGVIKSVPALAYDLLMRIHTSHKTCPQ